MAAGSSRCWRLCRIHRRRFLRWCREHPLGFYGVTSLVIILLWLGPGHLPQWVPRLSSGMKPGEYGDSFGFINSLFSGLALAAVIVTLLMQHQELRLQRKELEETRKELKRSADAQRESERALALTAYLSALHELREEVRSEAKQELGRDQMNLAGRELAQLNREIRMVVDEQRFHAAQTSSRLAPAIESFRLVLSRARFAKHEFQRRIEDFERRLPDMGSGAVQTAIPETVQRACYYWYEWVTQQADALPEGPVRRENMRQALLRHAQSFRRIGTLLEEWAQDGLPWKRKDGAMSAEDVQKFYRSEVFDQIDRNCEALIAEVAFALNRWERIQELRDTSEMRDDAVSG